MARGSSLIREHIKKRFTRSKDWPRVRNAYIQANPICACCGKHYKFLGKWLLCVHHIKPVHLFPELELVWHNLLPLCNNPRCHLDKGHLGDWRAWNPSVAQDCREWRNKYLNRLYGQ